MSSRGIPLYDQSTSQVQGNPCGDRDDISSASLRASKWLADARLKTGPFGRATSVWKCLTAPQGNITRMLSPVMDNDQTRVDIVRAELSDLQSDQAVAIIHRTDHMLEKGKTPKTRDHWQRAKLACQRYS